MSIAPEGRELICSAKDCGQRAVHGLVWRNTRIHTDDRRKIWLACDEHRESLSQFLSMRGFPLTVVGVDELD